MTKVGKSDWEGMFARTRGNDDDAPIPDLGTLPKPAVRPRAVIHCWRARLIQASPGDGSNSENADGRAQGGQRIALPLTVRVVGGENLISPHQVVRPR
jgi:hypothetical protein